MVGLNLYRKNRDNIKGEEFEFTIEADYLITYELWLWNLGLGCQ